jgi:hypothetical protein
VGTSPFLFSHICLLYWCLLFSKGDLLTINPSVDVYVCASWEFQGREIFWPLKASLLPVWNYSGVVWSPVYYLWQRFKLNVNIWKGLWPNARSATFQVFSSSFCSTVPVNVYVIWGLLQILECCMLILGKVLLNICRINRRIITSNSLSPPDSVIAVPDYLAGTVRGLQFWIAWMLWTSIELEDIVLSKYKVRETGSVMR